MAKLEEVLGKKISSVKELREEIKRLQDSLVGLDAESKEFKTTSEQLAVAQDELNKVTKAGTQDNIAAADSIAGMETQYKKLYKQYKQLSDAQRKSSFGKGMEKELKTLSESINNTKKGVGNFTSNIGNYANSAVEAFQKMGISANGAMGSIGKLGSSMKAFGASSTAALGPIGLVVAAIAALVAILKKGTEAISKNEESQMRMQKAMSAFQPIIDKVNNAFDKLGQMIVSVAEKIGEWTKKLRVAIAAATDFLHITKGRKEAVQEEIKVYDGLIDAEQKLTKAKRETQVANSELEAQIEALREEASDTEDVTKKQELLNQAKEKQGQIDQANIAIAKEELRILQEKAKLTPNSASDNQALADAQVKVNKAVAEGERNARSYNKQLNSLKTTTKGATDANKDAAKALYEGLIEATKTEIQKLEEKYKKEKKLLEKYHLDTKLLTQKYYKDRLAIMDKAAKEERKKNLQLRQQMAADIKEYDEAVLNSAETYEQKKSALELQVSKDEIALSGLESIYNKAKGYFDEFAATVVDGTLKAGETMEDFFQDILMFGDSTQYPFNLLNDLLAEATILADKDIKSIKGLSTAIILLKNSIKDTKTEISGLTKERKEALEDEADKKAYDRLAKTEEEYLQSILSIREADYLSEEKKNIYIIQADEVRLRKQKDILKDELANWKGTLEGKLDLQEQYYEVLEEYAKREKALIQLSEERNVEWTAGIRDGIQSISDALSTWRSSFEQLTDAQLDNEKIDAETAKKRKKRMLALQAVEMNLNILSIAGSTAGAIMNIWKAYAAEKIANAETAAATGPAAAVTLTALNTKSLVSAIAQTVGVASTGLAQIAAARNGYVTAKNNMEAENGSSNPSASVTPVEINSTPYTYTRQVQTVEEEEKLNQPIWVSVSDISDGLGRQVKVTDESSF